MAKQGHCSHFLRIHVVEKTVLLNNPVNSHKTVKLRTTWLVNSSFFMVSSTVTCAVSEMIYVDEGKMIMPGFWSEEWPLQLDLTTKKGKER